ncbi:MAG TPA: alkaline phosphatase PhoX, partial [Steroidobacteraceae bacterium]
MTRSTEPSTPFVDLLEQRLSRRSILSAAALAPLVVGSGALLQSPQSRADTAALRFRPIAPSSADTIVLPRGYTYDIVARWGDSLFSNVPDLDASKLASGILFEPN